MTSPVQSALCNRHTMLATLLLLLGACAGTGATSPAEQLQVRTSPVGAACSITRDGTLLEQIDHTPGLVSVGRSTGNLIVECRLDGYEPTAETISPRFEYRGGFPIAFGFGTGLAGISVSPPLPGNGHFTYPTEVEIELAPNNFSSAVARDEHYGRARAKLEAKYVRVIASARSKCQPHQADTCSEIVRGLEMTRDAELDALEQKRLRAKIST